MTFVRCILIFVLTWIGLGAGHAAEIIKAIQSEGMTVKVERVLKGRGVIWGFVFLDAQRILFTEREGRLNLLDLSSGMISPIRGVPKVLSSGQGGLLDIALHPKFEDNGQVYLSYSIAVGRKNATRVSLFQLKANTLGLIKHIVTSEPASDRTIHFGSRLAIDQKGHLFISIGDRGYRDQAQQLNSHGGKILRFRLDGSIPKDNPFTHQKGALPEIWSYGHRNPQGLTLHPMTDQLWAQEHGPRGGDELNLIGKGLNYGWPIITYGKEYWGPSIGEGTAKKGMQQPIHYYVPSIAPSGLTFYSGKKLKAWQGDLFLGALKLTHINRLKLKERKVVREERLIDDWEHRIRAVRESPDELLYASTDDGQIIRLRP